MRKYYLFSCRHYIDRKNVSSQKVMVLIIDSRDEACLVSTLVLHKRISHRDLIIVEKYYIPFILIPRSGLIIQKIQINIFHLLFIPYREL